MRRGVYMGVLLAVTVLYTALKRSSKFERVAGKAWGLSEWYPERRKKAAEDKNLPDPSNPPDHNPLADME